MSFNENLDPLIASNQHIPFFLTEEQQQSLSNFSGNKQRKNAIQTPRVQYKLTIHYLKKIFGSSFEFVIDMKNLCYYEELNFLEDSIKDLGYERYKGSFFSIICEVNPLIWTQIYLYNFLFSTLRNNYMFPPRSNETLLDIQLWNQCSPQQDPFLDDQDAIIIQNLKKLISEMTKIQRQQTNEIQLEKEKNTSLENENKLLLLKIQEIEQYHQKQQTIQSSKSVDLNYQNMNENIIHSTLDTSQKSHHYGMNNPLISHFNEQQLEGSQLQSIDESIIPFIPDNEKDEIDFNSKVQSILLSKQEVDTQSAQFQVENKSHELNSQLKQQQIKIQEIYKQCQSGLSQVQQNQVKSQQNVLDYQDNSYRNAVVEDNNSNVEFDSQLISVGQIDEDESEEQKNDKQHDLFSQDQQCSQELNKNDSKEDDLTQKKDEKDDLNCSDEQSAQRLNEDYSKENKLNCQDHENPEGQNEDNPKKNDFNRQNQETKGLNEDNFKKDDFNCQNQETEGLEEYNSKKDELNWQDQERSKGLKEDNSKINVLNCQDHDSPEGLNEVNSKKNELNYQHLEHPESLDEDDSKNGEVNCQDQESLEGFNEDNSKKNELNCLNQESPEGLNEYDSIQENLFFTKDELNSQNKVISEGNYCIKKCQTNSEKHESNEQDTQNIPIGTVDQATNQQLLNSDYLKDELNLLESSNRNQEQLLIEGHDRVQDIQYDIQISPNIKQSLLEYQLQKSEYQEKQVLSLTQQLGQARDDILQLRQQIADFTSIKQDTIQILQLLTQQKEVQPINLLLKFATNYLQKSIAFHRICELYRHKM